MKWDLNVLVYSVICGILIGLIYEVFRILRVTLFPSSAKIPKFEMKQLPGTSEEIAVIFRGETERKVSAPYVFTVICDVLFGIIGGICAAVLIFHTNNGEVRWFALAGCVLGFTVYMLTFGKMILRIYLKIKSFVFKIVKKILSILFLPIIIPSKAIIKRIKKRIIKRKARKNSNDS